MVDWGSTAIHGRVKGHPSHDTLAHVTDIETSLTIVRQGSIKPHPERERGTVLLDKPVDVVWLSPNQWGGTDGNEYGCIAFTFKWAELIEEYGEHVYGLEVLKDTRLPTSRILFSNKRYRRWFGECYDSEADGVPWKTRHGVQYIKDGCVLQVAVAGPVSLCDLDGIEFVHQRQGRGRTLIMAQDAARLFLARAASEPLRAIPGFTGITKTTKRPHREFLFAWERLWGELWSECERGKYDCHGTIRPSEAVAETLARTFLDRYGKLLSQRRSKPTLLEDAKNIASLFRCPKDLLLSVRKAVARWAQIDDRNSMNGKDWPPWQNPE